VTTNQEVIEEEEYGKEFFIVQKSLELICCVIAMVAIWKLLKDETKEIEWNSKQHDHRHNSSIEGFGNTTTKFTIFTNPKQ
jgi:hypothetical protein